MVTGRPSTTAAICSPTAAAATCGCARLRRLDRLRRAFATGRAGAITDMAFVPPPPRSRCTTRSAAARCARSRHPTHRRGPTSSTLRCRRRRGSRVLRHPPPRRSGNNPLRSGTRYVPSASIRRSPKAALVNFAFVTPSASRLPHRVGGSHRSSARRRTSTRYRARSLPTRRSCRSTLTAASWCTRLPPPTSSSMCSGYFDVAVGRSARVVRRRLARIASATHAAAVGRQPVHARAGHVPDRQRSRRRRGGLRRDRGAAVRSSSRRVRIPADGGGLPQRQPRRGAVLRLVRTSTPTATATSGANLVVVPLGADGIDRPPSAVGARRGRRCRRLLHVGTRAASRPPAAST